MSLAVAAIDSVIVRDHDAGLWAEVEDAAREMVAVCGINQLAEDPAVQAVRAMYRAVGVDPTRYRPASEALVRRLLQGKGLPQVNTVVDINNLHSMTTRLPWGVYDRRHIEGDVVFRLGATGEKYAGIGKPDMDASGKLVLADAEGVFGSPSADAQRTQVTLDTHDLLWVVFVPPGTVASATASLDAALKRLVEYNGGHIVLTRVV